jgi:hypothetical protein
MFCAVNVCDAGLVPEVLRANVKPEAEFVPALLAAPVLTPVTSPLLEVATDITALSAQRGVSVCVVLPLVSLDETSGLATVTFRVQTPLPSVKPQVPLLFIATDKFCATPEWFPVTT